MIDKKYHPIILTVVLFVVIALVQQKNESQVLSVSTGSATPLSNVSVDPVKYSDKRSLFNTLTEQVENIDGAYSIYIKDLGSGEIYQTNTNEKYDPASLVKVFISASVMKVIEQGRLDLESPVSLTGQDWEEGAGPLYSMPTGSTYKVEDLLEFALKKSDNTASNMLTRSLGGKFIDTKMFIPGNTVTVAEMGEFFERFHNGGFVSNDSVSYLEEIMLQTDYDDRIDLGLNAELDFAHKIGNSVNGSSWHDCGIVIGGDRDVIVCVMSKDALYDDFLSVAQRTGNFVNLIF